MSSHFRDYVQSLHRERSTGKATEHTYRPALKTLLESLESGIVATNEPKRIKCGAPDYFIERRGVPVGYVECKDIGVSLDDEESSEQIVRYLGSMDNLILTDYLEFRHYIKGKLANCIRIAKKTTSGGVLYANPNKNDLESFFGVFLATQSATITSTNELVRYMANIA